MIVDDEPLGRVRIRRLLEEDSDIEIIGECCSGKEAVRSIQEKKPDLVFMDVQMPEMNGFEVLEALGAVRLPVIVFVTAYDHYALKAFEFYPVDFLLKPFARDRFRQTVLHAKEQLMRGVEKDLREVIRMAQKEQKYLERLSVRSNGRIVFLNLAQVEWIEAQGRFSTVHVGSESYPLRESLLTLANHLNPGIFFRISRSALVNSDHIRELQQMDGGDYEVVLHSGKRLTLSRRYLSNVEDLFSHH